MDRVKRQRDELQAEASFSSPLRNLRPQSLAIDKQVCANESQSSVNCALSKTCSSPVDEGDEKTHSRNSQEGVKARKSANRATIEKLLGLSTSDVIPITPASGGRRGGVEDDEDMFSSLAQGMELLIPEL